MSSVFTLSSPPLSPLPFDMALSIPSEIPSNSLLSPITSLPILQERESYSTLKNTTLTFTRMERRLHPPENLIDIILTIAPTFVDAQSARGSDTFEKTVATTSASNANSGDQDTPPPIVPLNKKGTINSGRKNGKKHRLDGKLLIRELMKKRRSL